MKRTKIQIYGVYAFDILNQLNLKEYGTCTVQVLEKQKRFLKPPIYKVISLQTQQLIAVEAKYLTPIPKDTTECVLIRYPDSIPVINQNDIMTINKVISITDPSDPYYLNLCKLQSKMEYYSKVRYL